MNFLNVVVQQCEGKNVILTYKGVKKSPGSGASFGEKYTFSFLDWHFYLTLRPFLETI